MVTISQMCIFKWRFICHSRCSCLNSQVPEVMVTVRRTPWKTTWQWNVFRDYLTIRPVAHEARINTNAFYVNRGEESSVLGAACRHFTLRNHSKGDSSVTEKVRWAIEEAFTQWWPFCQDSILLDLNRCWRSSTQMDKSERCWSSYKGLLLHSHAVQICRWQLNTILNRVPQVSHDFFFWISQSNSKCLWLCCLQCRTVVFSVGEMYLTTSVPHV